MDNSSGAIATHMDENQGKSGGAAMFSGWTGERFNV